MAEPRQPGTALDWEFYGEDRELVEVDLSGLEGLEPSPSFTKFIDNGPAGTHLAVLYETRSTLPEERTRERDALDVEIAITELFARKLFRLTQEAPEMSPEHSVNMAHLGLAQDIIVSSMDSQGIQDKLSCASDLTDVFREHLKALEEA